MEKEIELPTWFSMIQSERDYYIDAYKKQQEGKNKFNFKVFFSSIFCGGLYLYYRKFGILYALMFLMGLLLAGNFVFYFMSINSIIDMNYEYIFKDDNISYIISYFSFSIVMSSVFIANYYNKLYFKYLKKKNKKGYNIENYKEKSFLLAATSLLFYIVFMFCLASGLLNDLSFLKLMTAIKNNNLSLSIFVFLLSFFNITTLSASINMMFFVKMYDYIKVKYYNFKHRNNDLLIKKDMTESDNSNLPEWFSLIKKNKDDYKDMYINQSKRFLKISFNWSAALLSPLWFAYRKMYIESIIFSVISTLLSIFMFYKTSYLFPIFFEMIICGFLGNYLYFRFLKKKFVTYDKGDIYIDVNKSYMNFALIAYFIMICCFCYFQWEDLINMIKLIRENKEYEHSIMTYNIEFLSFVLVVSSAFYFYKKEKKDHQ